MSVKHFEQLLSDVLANPRQALVELDRLDCEESLIKFLQGGWKYIDPAPYSHGWHLEAIAEHLQAVTDGDIRRLIINIPPRHSKSSLVSVAWPAWTWAQKPLTPLAGPQVQFLSSSYAQALSTRDALKSRRLLQSPWFQERWGDRFELTGDQNAKMRYENDKGGYRIATSVGGGLTGEGGSVILIDDPLNAQEALSEATRAAMVSWWDEAMSTRLNDPRNGAYVIIMQRLHEQDLTGHILASNHEDWVHLCLPARYEPERKCVTVIGWEDPRTVPGAILAPERFGNAELIALERSLGPYAAAGQLQQRPAPRGGGIFRRDWWQLWDEETAIKFGCEPGVFPPCEYVVASADTAYTEKEENDYSALTVWGVFRDRAGLPRAMMMHAWKVRKALHGAEQPPRGPNETAAQYRRRCWEEWGLVECIADTCRRFKVDRLLIEGKASGISVAQEMRRLYSREGWAVEIINPGSLDKVARAYAVQPLFSDEMVFAPGFDDGTFRDWAEMVVTEMETFPKSPHKDITDSATQALSHLRKTGILRHGAEIAGDITDDTTHVGRKSSAPLYPGVG